MKRISEISPKDIISIHQFGSSVEGRTKPKDIDIFVIVKNGKYKFRRIDGLYNPHIFEEGVYQYFVMPEDGGEDLLNAMLYTGRKDPDRRHAGIAVKLETIPKLINVCKC